jgi:hypothetical protein
MTPYIVSDAAKLLIIYNSPFIIHNYFLPLQPNSKRRNDFDLTHTGAPAAAGAAATGI